MDTAGTSIFREKRFLKPIKEEFFDQQLKLHYDLELEKTIIGSLLLERNIFLEYFFELKEEDFYDINNNLIFKALRKIDSSGQPPDLRSLNIQLAKDGVLEMVGKAYGAECLSMVSQTSNIKSHIYYLKELTVARNLAVICTQFLRRIHTFDGDILKIRDELEHKVISLMESQTNKSMKSLKEVMNETFASYSRADKNVMPGVPSGLAEVDARTGGWRQGDLICIAARPGNGKTMLALECAKYPAVEHNIPTAIFLMEIPNDQGAKRMNASHGELDYSDIYNGRLSNENMKWLMENNSKLWNAPIYFDDSPSTLSQLLTKIRRAYHIYGVRLFIIDYLQLLRIEGFAGNREQEISTCSRTLKLLAKELNVPIIILSQLTRSVETQPGHKIPQLFHLRESGAIEQDTDIILFIYRPELYKFAVCSDEITPSFGVAELIFAKFRNGSTGNVKVKINSKYMKFSNL